MPPSRNSRIFFGIVMLAIVLYLPLWRGSTSLVGGRGIDSNIPTATRAEPSTITYSTTTARVTSNLHRHPYNTTTFHQDDNSDNSDNSDNNSSNILSFCFIVSVYGQWAAHVDQLQRVDKLSWYNQSQFFAFTNLPNLHCKGWTKVVAPLKHYRRYITQSRYAKCKKPHCHRMLYQKFWIMCR
jgi:hypothetical protein